MALFGCLSVLFVFRLLLWSVTTYEIFNDRIVISNGLIGRDIKMIPLENLRSVAVEVGLIGKLSGTGNLRFFSGEMETRAEGSSSKYDMFEAVSTPYDLLQLVETARKSKNTH